MAIERPVLDRKMKLQWHLYSGWLIISIFYGLSLPLSFSMWFGERFSDSPPWTLIERAACLYTYVSPIIYLGLWVAVIQRTVKHFPFMSLTEKYGQLMLLAIAALTLIGAACFSTYIAYN